MTQTPLTTGRPQYAMEVFASAVSFHDTAVGQVSETQNVLLTNIGYDFLTIYDVTVVGPFEIVGTPPEEILPGESEAIQVRFKPVVEADDQQGGIYVDTGDAAGKEFISLSGSSFSTETPDLATSLVRATNAGTGAQNYIQATTEQVLPVADNLAIVIVPITHTNTSTPVQIAFNANPPLTVKDYAGNDMEVGELVEDTTVIGYIFNGEFRLLIDQQSAAIFALLQAIEATIGSGYSDIEDSLAEMQTLLSDAQDVLDAVTNSATGAALATQAEAEAGINNTKAMTPLRTKEAITAIGATLFATTAQGAKADTAIQPATFNPVSALAATAIQPAAFNPVSALANSAVQPGDNISDLTNDSGFLTTVAINAISDVTISTPADNEVLAYNGSGQWINQTAAEAGLATAAQGALADSAVQPGDNISTLTNDSGFITDYTVTEEDVTTHQAALSITESQISDFGVYLSDINSENIEDLANVSITDLADGDMLVFNQTTGMWENAEAASGGVSDHGSMTGLADDDHTQYHTDGRADTWLGTKTTDDLSEGASNKYNVSHTGDATGASALSVVGLRGKGLDSTVANPDDGDILVFRSADDDWVLEAKPASGSNPAINDIVDVTITGPTADNEVLAYHSATSKWINQTAAEAGLATAAQGALASSALQAGANISLLTNNAGFITNLNSFDTDNLSEGASNKYNATHTGDATGASALTVVGLRGVSLDGSVGSPNDGDILVFRSAGSDWVLESKPTSGSNPALADVTNVTIDGTPADNEVLAYDNSSGQWKNQTAAEAGLATAAQGALAASAVQPGDLPFGLDAAVTLANSALQPGDVTNNLVFETLADAEAYLVDDPVDGFMTLGYSTIGDKGGARYVKMAGGDPTIPGQRTINLTGGGTARYRVSEVIVTPQMFGAPSDGVLMAHLQLQQAIDFVHAMGGGEVYIPAGRYKLAAQITIKYGVKVRGAGYTNGQRSANFGNAVGCTTLEVWWGDGALSSNDWTKAAIVMNSASGISDLNIHHPEQEIADNAVVDPIEYGAAILGYEDSAETYLGDITVERIYLVCPYVALDFRGQGVHPNTKNITRLRVTDVVCSPMKYGLRICRITDFSNIVRFLAQPGLLSNDPANPARNWINNNCTFIETGPQCDWVNFENCAAWACWRGVHLNGVGPVDFINCKFDAMSDCVVYCQYAHKAKFLGCTFTAFDAYEYASSGNFNTAADGVQIFFMPEGGFIEGLIVSDCEIFAGGQSVLWGYHGSGLGTASDILIRGNNYSTLATNMGATPPTVIVNYGDNIRVYDNNFKGLDYVFATPNNLTRAGERDNVFT